MTPTLAIVLILTAPFTLCLAIVLGTVIVGGVLSIFTIISGAIIAIFYKGEL